MEDPRSTGPAGAAAGRVARGSAGIIAEDQVRLIPAGSSCHTRGSAALPVERTTSSVFARGSAGEILSVFSVAATIDK